jgi:hypothetical protein
MKGKSEKERERMIETLLEVELVSIWLSSLPHSLLPDDQRLVSAEKKYSVSQSNFNFLTFQFQSNTP